MSASWLYIALGGGLAALCFGFFGLYSLNKVRSLKLLLSSPGAAPEVSVNRWEIAFNCSIYLLLLTTLTTLALLANASKSFA